MSQELVQYLTGAGVVGIVAAVWRLGTQVARQNGTVATLVRDLADHRADDRHLFERLFDRLEHRRGWFRRG